MLPSSAPVLRSAPARDAAVSKAAIGRALLRQFPHDPDQVRLALEPDAWQFGHGDLAGLPPHAFGEAAVGLEQVRVALVAAEAEAGRDVQRHLVPTVGDA